MARKKRHKKKREEDGLVKTVKRLHGPSKPRKAGPMRSRRDEEKEDTGRRTDRWKHEWEDAT
jgi:hypothetical protein